MRRYSSVSELVNAKAKLSHKANLTSGGVFGANNKRTSNLQAEKQYARSRLQTVIPSMSKQIIGHGIRKSHVYIKGVGYAPGNK